MNDHALYARALTKSYGGTRVLDGLDLAVPRGSVLALLGPNGAGKTTTVRILATLTAPDSGTARVAGHDIAGARALVRERIALTGQFAALDDLQTGAETLRMTGRLTGLSARDARDRAAELLERFGLTEVAGTLTKTYSGGIRRRLDLAASLVGRPEVLFLDEPTTGLDPRSRLELWDVVREMRADGTTVLLTTQYLEEADRLADRVTVLDAGRIAAEGTPAELKTRVAGHRLDLTLTSRRAYEALAARAVHHAPDELTLGLSTDGSAAHVRALLDELDPDRTAVGRFTVRSTSLDDVFLALTGASR
ncbi:daunorubicin resistance protein DrrA family ABC transporter ATP-binding protein [Streptomyces sp. C]|uniref:daunorubicin resistance protein DrrA family ABC transporter ATP-binding protein n=1 Tax=Streptomyces sp. C TaxID=253839 RepID=UPI0001B58266|nr:daunorubicin resistance protein DrrA family ABC transporter ATP-binding protein [Streptomyces sp. C]EFL15818.1 nodulation ABC transporter NodI [Streptomyces sp. C]